MAIQQRRGADADFDANKMLAGEMAITTDGTRKVYVAFAPGDVKELASAEEVQKIIDEFNEDVAGEIEKAKEEIEQKKEDALVEIPDYEKQIAELELYKANSILCKASGTTILTTDSAKAKLLSLTPYGKSTQRQYEGWQLIKEINSVSGGTSTISEGCMTAKTDARTSTSYFTIFRLKLDDVEFTSGNTYYISTDIKLISGSLERVNTFLLFDNNGNQINGVNRLVFPSVSGNYQRYTASLTVDSDILLSEIAIQGYVSTDAVIEMTKLMLSAKENAEWEPFVGNAPSPSLEYKQEVTPIGEGGSINAWLLGKNIFAGNVVGGYLSGIDGSISNEKPEDLSNVVSLKNYIPLLENILTVVIPEFSLDMSNAFAYRVGFYDKDKKWITNVIITQETTKIQALENARYVRFSAGSLNTMAVYFGDISDAVYDEPTSQPLTYQTPNGLHGIPLGQTIPDVIKNSPIHMSGVYWDVVEQQYYIGDTKNEDGKDVQRNGEYTITGNEYWQSEDNSYGGNIPINMLLDNYDLFDCGITRIDYGLAKLPDNNGAWFHWKADSSKWQTLEEWKSIIAGKTIYYILADPIITDTSAEELEQYNAIHMNYPNTTIVNDAGAYQKVEYVCDTKEHIKQNYTPNSVTQDIITRLSALESNAVNNS